MTKPALSMVPSAERFRDSVIETTEARRRYQELERFHLENLQRLMERRSGDITAKARAVGEAVQAHPPDASAWMEYCIDWWQRGVLFGDILRRRSDNYVAHLAAGEPPVLAFDYEIIVDGRTLDRPVNYALVRVIPGPEHDVQPYRRPYMIVDPRAGHGPGIGGFKDDSQVGVALRDGHPTYVVIFFPQPEPQQTLADVTAAEAIFVRTIRERHPDSQRPAVVGNCQGGWGVMLLAATNPDITGPLVLNGAPLAYWSGEQGKNPMRYMGGLLGGIVPALLAADLGNGKFDGANLVMNFETLSPGNVWWKKYYDVFAAPEAQAERFLEFERWWGGYYFMNESEIRWIVENLFVGNKLARGQAFLDAHTRVDLTKVKSPIVVFASHGDNITPVPQAVNWIADCYRDEHEIKVHGQRIIYLIHPTVGHLGIFVSAKVAKSQHTEISSVMQMIEALAPGLFEMVITKEELHDGEPIYHVAFEERTMAQLLELDDKRDDESMFAAVKRLSELNALVYDTWFRPFVQAMGTPEVAKALVDSNPLRVQRRAFSSQNPMMAWLPWLTQSVAAQRKQAAADNPFVRMEHLWADMIEGAWDSWRDTRDATAELTFQTIYDNPYMLRLGLPELDYWLKQRELDLRTLPDVREALGGLRDGSYVDAVVRMLILMAKSRGAVRRSRLARSQEILMSRAPFSSLSRQAMNQVIRQQTVIVDFEPELAIDALPAMLPDLQERRDAMALIEEVAGARAEMAPGTIALLARFTSLFDLDGDGVSTSETAAS
ncbi:MAG: DUF3141 domain-containing protein [Pseudomonadota bacterium]